MHEWLRWAVPHGLSFENRESTLIPVYDVNNDAVERNYRSEVLLSLLLLVPVDARVRLAA